MGLFEKLRNSISFKRTSSTESFKDNKVGGPKEDALDGENPQRGRSDDDMDIENEGIIGQSASQEGAPITSKEPFVGTYQSTSAILEAGSHYKQMGQPTNPVAEAGGEYGELKVRPEIPADPGDSRASSAASEYGTHKLMPIYTAPPAHENYTEHGATSSMAKPVDPYGTIPSGISGGGKNIGSSQPEGVYGSVNITPAEAGYSDIPLNGSTPVNSKPVAPPDPGDKNATNKLPQNLQAEIKAAAAKFSKNGASNLTDAGDKTKAAASTPKSPEAGQSQGQGRS